MNLLYVIYTHNRPNVLQTCLQTLFGNSGIKPDRVVILDDCSDNNMKGGLFKFCLDNSPNVPIDFLSFNKNIGYGTNFEMGLSITKVFNPKYVFFIESDYVFRKEWAEDVMGVLTGTEIGQKCAGMSGYDNPDFYNPSKFNDMFRRIIAEDFGEDNVDRENMFKRTDITIGTNVLGVNGVSNSCGTMYLNWEFCMMLMERYPEMQKKWWERMCNKQEGGNRRYLADGIMSHGLSYYWSKWAKETGVDTKNFFPLLNIIPSVAEHKNALGINGNIPGIQEGQTFVGSPSWKE